MRHDVEVKMGIRKRKTIALSESADMNFKYRYASPFSLFGTSFV